MLESSLLNSKVLFELGQRGVQVPHYSLDISCGVVHIGLGAFHRAHQALVFDALLELGDLRWGVLGVAMKNSDLATAIEEQNGLYSIEISGEYSSRWRICGAIRRTCVAAFKPDSVAIAIASLTTRWITLTVTEKGYSQALCDLLIPGLLLRFENGLPGITLASCDNLANNGSHLRSLCITAADLISENFGEWIDSSCAFPCSMVDRIVPASTPERIETATARLGFVDKASLGTESFWEWVIERKFADDADTNTLSSVGVRVVDDISIYEEAKLRMLNGSHTAMACMGAILGIPVIGECIAHPEIRKFIHEFMTNEASIGLRRPHLLTYRDELIQRFGNSSLQHKVHQIVTDSSQKIPQRWPPSILECLDKGLSVDRLVFVAAVWIRYLFSKDESGRPFNIVDPMSIQLSEILIKFQDRPRLIVSTIMSISSIWGLKLSKNQEWIEQVQKAFLDISENGLVNALKNTNSR